MVLSNVEVKALEPELVWLTKLKSAISYSLKAVEKYRSDLHVCAHAHTHTHTHTRKTL